MATITTILGTDSISSSRTVLNANFDSLNVDLNEVMALLNADNQTIDLAGSAAFGSLVVTDILSATAAGGLVCEKEATFNKAATFKSIKLTVQAAGSLPAATSFEYSIYQVDTSSTSAENLNDGVEGQEITIISNGGGSNCVITAVAATFKSDGAGLATLTLTGNESAVLRFVNGSWYIISTSGTEA
jgi:hypothetical protein